MVDERADVAKELDHLLDELSYALTEARSSGMGRPQQLRGALKRAVALATNAEALAATLEMRRRSGQS